MPGEEDNKQIGAGAGAGPVTVNGYTIDPGASGFATLVAAAQTMNLLPDFSAQAACAPVKAFQAAWNAAGGTPQLSVDGGYGQDSANANAAVATIYGGNVPGPASSFPNCGGGNPPTPPNPNPQPPVPSGGMKTWVKVLLWLLVGGGVVGLGVLIYRWMSKGGGAREGKRRRRGKNRRRKSSRRKK